MAVAAPLALAATGLSAASSIMGGMQTAKGDEMEQQNAVDAATIGRTKAAQTDTDMRRQLSSTLSNISAVRASAGLNPDSPTGQAIASNVEGRADVNRTQAVDNINAQVTMDQNAASFYGQSASSALLGGMMGGLGSIFKGIGGAIPT